VVGVDARIVIVGAGPCGLACGRQLTKLGHRNWLIVERASQAGGLASSVTDARGFTWDLGGHVVFSHFGEFDALLAETMGDELNHHDRSSYVRITDRWVPYPFQNNLRHLAPGMMEECLHELSRAPGGNSEMDFRTWMHATFGSGITRYFMAPYNFKVWATRPEDMASDWIAERVSVVDYEKVRRNVLDGRDELAWGPNNRFSFPARGGTGEIYRRASSALKDHISYSAPVRGVDPAAQRVVLEDGRDEQYDALVSTMPLDSLVRAMPACPDEIRDAASHLQHNSVYMVGVGYEQALTDDKSWMYFPDPSLPFYRVTNFAKYAATNVPEADTGRYSAYMTETAYSEDKPEPRTGLEDRVELGLRTSGVVAGDPTIASIHVEDIPYAYPVPTRERDKSLAVIQPWLMSQNIYSRGRFGSWRYEIGNMDHAVKMGIDIANRLIAGSEEELWRS
jgi:protoporphyrinogen oxidase